MIKGQKIYIYNFLKNKQSSLVILGCVLLNIIIVLIIYPKFAIIGSDATAYALIAKNLVQEGRFELYGLANTYFSPALPFTIAFFYKFLHNLELSAHLAVIFFGIASAPLFYLLVRKISSQRSAILGAILLALNGEWIWNYTTTATPQVIAGFLSILLFILLINAFKQEGNLRTPAWFLFALIGVVNGLMYLARPEYFFLIFPILIYSAYIFRDRLTFKKAIASLVLIFAGFLIVSGPYLLFLHKNLHTWTISGRLGAITLGTSGVAYEDLSKTSGNELVTDIVNSGYFEQSGGGFMEAVKNNKFFVLKKLFKGLRDSERNLVKMLGLLGAGFSILGVRDFLLKKRYKELILISIFLSPIVLVAFGQGGTPEYLVQFLYLFLLLIAVGFWSFYCEISEKLSPNKVKRRLLFSLAPLTVLYLFFPLIQVYLFLPKDINPKEAKTMGLWMKDNISNVENEVVLSRSPEFSFYAGSKWQIVPNVPTLEKLYGIMASNQVRYLIIDDRNNSTRPQFSSLLDETKQHRPLQLVHKETYYDKNILLYRLNYSGFK